jgi:MFS family permease
VTSPRHKRAYFVLEGLNALATTYYGYFVFFHLRRTFGFDNLHNLAFGALYGFCFMVGALNGGRFAQKFGYFRALKTGFATMSICLLAGLFWRDKLGQGVVLVGWTIGMCFTWPTLEALASEGETPRSLQRQIGIYNLVWSGAAALAYFFGGAALDYLGDKSLFYIPPVIHVAQFILVGRIQKWPATPKKNAARTEGSLHTAEELRRAGRVSPEVFLKLAWIANPFAYVAINTMIATMPAIAHRLGLSPLWAGVFCSIWLFARMAAFGLLWRWTGWHYRFRWFIAAYITIVLAFFGVLLAPSLAALIVAQLVFGGAAGLTYYSSLYYSMDVGETKGEHGGFHEAALGSGQFLGPATGALALWLYPRYANIDVWAVGFLLAFGLVILLAVRGLAGRMVSKAAGR